jgi:hypothetical protein
MYTNLGLFRLLYFSLETVFTGFLLSKKINYSKYVIFQIRRKIFYANRIATLGEGEDDPGRIQNPQCRGFIQEGIYVAASDLHFILSCEK